MQISKILTHAGTFHADEVSACALLSMFTSAPIERRYNPTQAELDDYTVLVLDQGRVYDDNMLNFDHHQAADLPASNMLVLAHLYYNKFLSKSQADFLEKKLFKYISDVDTGKVIEGSDAAPTINGIIRSLNTTDDGFFSALQVARIAIQGCLDSHAAFENSEMLWANCETYLTAKITHSTEHILEWREKAIRDGYLYLITPNPREKGSYSITTIDSKTLSIPSHPSQTFRHNSGFIAAYPSLESAIAHLKILSNNV